MSTAARAAHPIVDDPPYIFIDDAASKICRSMAASPLDYQLANPAEPVLAAARLSACTRARCAADAFRASELSQYVLLGAGLDYPVCDPSVRCWAIDLPGVLEWRTEVFANAGMPDRCIHVPADLTGASLVPALLAADLDADEPVFIAWLGGTMYLDRASIDAVFTELAHLRTGSVMIADFILPATDRDGAGAAYAVALAGAIGGREPWRCTPNRDQIADMLSRAGWQDVQQEDEDAALPVGFWDRSDSLHPMRLVNLVETHN